MSARAPDAPPAALRWTVHPAADQPGRALLVAAILAGAGLFAGSQTGSGWVGLAAALLLAWSVRAWLLPRTYEVDEHGARESGPLCPGRDLAWEGVRRVSMQPFGLHLSPRAVDSRWLPDRGLLLRTAGNRPAVLAHVARHTPGARLPAAPGAHAPGAAA